MSDYVQRQVGGLQNVGVSEPLLGAPLMGLQSIWGIKGVPLFGPMYGPVGML